MRPRLDSMQDVGALHTKEAPEPVHERPGIASCRVQDGLLDGFVQSQIRRVRPREPRVNLSLPYVDMTRPSFSILNEPSPR